MPLDFKDNASLKPYNTMAVPAITKHLVIIKSISDLYEALKFAAENNLETLILGEGSNTLFVNDYSGLVILNRIKGIEVIEENKDSVEVKVASGENWHDFVSYALRKRWYGLENLGLIPGLVGAAPIQNIGAYGVELKDHLISVQYLDLKTMQMTELDCDECEFAYRNSIFKNALFHTAVICSITLGLSKKELVNLSYPALANYFSSNANPNPQQVFEAVCEIRSNKLPNPSEIPNTGSFFKNPIVSKDKHSELKNEYPDLPSYVIGNNHKLAAAWMIETLGWKNKSIANVCVHKTQALVITNPHASSGQNVLELAYAIQSEVNEKFAVNLEIEPQLI